MNILVDNLPYEVWIAGKMIPINTDYRTGILFEQCLDDIGQSDNQKLFTVLELYYGEYAKALVYKGIETVTEAVNKILWFYRCGTDEKVSDDEEGGNILEEPLYSYEYDGVYIYAAFLETYNIDLTQKRLHWWQFRALFLALPDTVKFQKIVGIRAVEITADMSKEQKRYYQKMKKLYELPENPEHIKLIKDIESILAEGGDISQLIE